MTLGEKLQALRKSRGISQEELAAQITVSRQAVSKWELGESTPDLQNIVQISGIFGVTTDYLLKDEVMLPTPTAPVTSKEEHETTGKVLLLASAAFLLIGLLAAFAGWNPQEPEEAVFGGMVVHVVGLFAYCLGRILLRQRAPLFLDIANLAMVLFLPVSSAVSLLSGKAISPYPLDVGSTFIFAILYSSIMILLFVLLKHRRKKHPGK